jgi:hypothetical protein
MGKGDPQGGRPRVEINMELLANMVGIQCPRVECASVLGVSESTIDRRLLMSAGFDGSRHKGGRRPPWKPGQSGNPSGRPNGI